MNEGHLMASPVPGLFWSEPHSDTNVGPISSFLKVSTHFATFFFSKMAIMLAFEFLEIYSPFSNNLCCQLLTVRAF
jgi:hypothetical protein